MRWGTGIVSLCLLASPAHAKKKPKPVPKGKVSVGVVTSGEYQVRRPSDGSTTGTSGNLGLDLGFRFGEPKLGIGVQTGFRRAVVEAPFLGADDESIVTVPLLIGVGSSPWVLFRGKDVTVRPDFGLFGGWMVPFFEHSNLSLSTGFALEGKIGLDFYFRRDSRYGLSVDLVIPAAALGSSARADQIRLEWPGLMIRFGLFYWTFPYGGKA